MEAIELFFTEYAGTLVVATLVAMALYRITDKLVEDIWQDYLGHASRPAFYDVLMATAMGVAGALAGYLWHSNIQGALVGFGATSFGTLLFNFIARRFK